MDAARCELITYLAPRLAGLSQPPSHAAPAPRLPGGCSFHPAGLGCLPVPPQAPSLRNWSSSIWAAPLFAWQSYPMACGGQQPPARRWPWMDPKPWDVPSQVSTSPRLPCGTACRTMAETHGCALAARARCLYRDPTFRAAWGAGSRYLCGQGGHSSPAHSETSCPACVWG